MQQRRAAFRAVRGDDGQLMASMAIFCGILIIAMLVVALVPVGEATNERSRSQTAADAAALAGADAARRQFAEYSTAPGPTLVFVPGVAVLVPPILPTTGYGSASNYANSNGSTLMAPYSLSLPSGEVTTRVQSKADATEEQYGEVGRAEATATAKMDVDFVCRWEGTPPPVPVYQGGPADFKATLRCGDWSALYTIANTPPLYVTISYDTTPSDIYDALEPRLVD